MTGSDLKANSVALLLRMERLAHRLMEAETAVAGTLARVAVAWPQRSRRCLELAAEARRGADRAGRIAAAAHEASLHPARVYRKPATADSRSRG